MQCDECEKLQKAEAFARSSLQEQRFVNRQWGIRGKSAEQSERALEQAYNLARAKTKLHKGECHQDEGYEVTIEDLSILVRNGRTEP